MSNRRQGGFNLLEILVAIVVIGVAVAGVVSAFSVSARSSADPFVRKQLLVVAEEIMEEIQLKPYTSAQAKVTNGCARSGYYQVADYNGYSTSALGYICDVDGLKLNELDGYVVSVTVTSGNLGSSTTAPGYLITVVVSKGTQESFTLVGWRTNYAS